jgi:PilZ domain-containing protein
MVEKRAKARRRTLKVGKIVFNGRCSVIDCTVRDLSDTGACLELPAGIGFPNSFDLMLGLEGWRRPCTVTWRSRNRIGVAFE